MSLEAEQAIVASLIEHSSYYDQISETLTVDDFVDDRMSLLYELISKMIEAGRSIDTITMAAMMSRSARWAQTGNDDPLAYVEALRDLSHSYTSTKAYVEIVKRASVQRRMLEYCQQVAGLAYDNELSVEQKLAQASLLMPSIDVSSDGFISYADAGKSAITKINNMVDGNFVGIKSGIDSLDKLIYGFEPGDLIVLAGRPSQGKSLYAMDWCHEAAKHGTVLAFSLEMTAESLGQRGLASLGGIDFGDLRSAKVDEHMVAKMQLAYQQMKERPIFIDDRGDLTVDQLRSRARVMARKHDLSMIMVDYIQLLEGVGSNETAQVAHISKSLKAMAKELKVPVLCLSQLNRSVDSRQDKRPLMSDLRQSGQIEQDADVVVFTYLHERYDPDTPRKGIGELIVRKQRNGPTGSVFTEFQGRYQRFVNYEGVVPPESDQEPRKRSKRGMDSFVPNSNLAAVNDERDF